MKEKIKIYLSDWQFNAGLVGLYNILEQANYEVKKHNQYIEIDISVLENFEEIYFNYFIEKYKLTTPWNRIVSYEKTIAYYMNNELENFDEKSLEKLNDYIKSIKDYLRRNNYTKVYPFIKSEIDIVGLVKELVPISKTKKNENIKSKFDEINDRFKKIRKIIDYCNSDDGKKYIIAKGVIYGVIDKGWNGVSFLNRNPKENDVYREYDNYFVEPALEYLNTDKEKYRYNCFVCDEPMKNMANDLNFMNETGFDVARKTSHTWDFYNDVAICEICKLVYSCLPAGFTYAYDKGIFVNNNSSVNDLIRTNQIIKDKVLQPFITEQTSLTYRALVAAISEEYSSNIQYELQDIQIINYDNEIYKFNILSKETLKIIRDSEKELNNLIKAGYKENKTYFRIYELTISRILNNYNMFTLIHKLLIYKITETDLINTYYNMNHLMNLNIININYLKGVEGMDKVAENKQMVKSASAYGYYLRKHYLELDQDADKSKLRGISYRLLNALKTRNAEMFMHNIITSYMYVGQAIPPKLTIGLESDEDLGIIGYAFVSGLNGGESDSKEKRNEEKNNEN